MMSARAYVRYARWQRGRTKSAVASGVDAVALADVARMELAESGVNKPANLGLRHRLIQATCRRGVKSTVLTVTEYAFAYFTPDFSGSF